MISMYLSGHFRSIARKALRGFWALTIGVTLAAALLGNLLGTALHHLAARKERLNAEHPPTSRT